MYMGWILDFIIKDKENKKDENTFILALDGDIDFKPDALEKLIELMKANENLGAACGRIHPIGAGPIVWYQVRLE